MKAIENRPADRAEIDAFCDSLWLEDGLAQASLSSYRSDLLHFSNWLSEHRLTSLSQVDELALMQFVAELSKTLRASHENLKRK